MNGEFSPLISALGNVIVEDDGFERIVDLAKAARETQTVFFIGNGGSAAIASHMACDWGKNGRFAALCFNDGSAMSCLANDLGYERVFSDPLERHCKEGDIVFAISSSGLSMSIVEAAWTAKTNGAIVVTLSGFTPDNRLRNEGDVNFYVPSRRYGVVEITHLAILHAILDKVMNVDAKAAA